MVNDNDEQISALVDGDLEGHDLKRALERLTTDPAARDRWGRYHLISDVLRNAAPERIPLDLHRRVAAAVENEPAILAPRRRHIDTAPLLRHAVGFAVAASVTAVAILGFQALNEEAGHTPQPRVAATQFDRLEPLQNGEQLPDGALNPYLVNHNEYSASSGIHGVLPYVRIVSQGSEE